MQKLGSLNRNVFGFERIPFKSSKSLLDFDALLIHLETLHAEYGSSEDPDGHVTLPFGIGSLVQRDVARRRAELDEFLSMGKSVAFLIAPPHKWDGSCGNNQRFSFSPLIPLIPFSAAMASGERIEFRGPEVLRPLFAANCDCFHYTAYLPEYAGTPFLYVRQSSRVLATYQAVGPGHLFLLPTLNLSTKESIVSFTDSFLSTVHALSGTEEILPPVWAENLTTVEELRLTAEGRSLSDEAEKLRLKLQITQEHLDSERRLKILLFGSGFPLQRATALVFAALGMTVEPVSPGRADIRLEYQGQRGVVEVKGKKGPAAEKDAAQLEKWVSEEIDSDGTRPKAFLAVNAYCETPPVDRTEPPFPHQMLAYSQRRQHCLVTTTQLLCLYLEARRHPERKEELARRLWSCEGVFEGFSDVKEFMRQAT